MPLVSKKRSRCPNGTRKNPITKKCDAVGNGNKTSKKSKPKPKPKPSSKRIVRRKKLKCPPGMIVRDGYTRKGFTRKTGTRVATIRVPSSCIKSRGLPGKTKDLYKDGKGIGPLKKGELGEHGYHNVKELGVRKRRLALRPAIAEFTALSIFRKLGAIRTYLKRTSPDASRIYLEDQRWVRKTFDGDFKGSRKTSAVFNEPKPVKMYV